MAGGARCCCHGRPGLSDSARRKTRECGGKLCGPGRVRERRGDLAIVTVGAKAVRKMSARATAVVLTFIQSNEAKFPAAGLRNREIDVGDKSRDAAGILREVRA